MFEFLKAFFNAIFNYDPDASGRAKADTIAGLLEQLFAYVEGILGI